MYCLQCGHGVPLYSRFCVSCGTALDKGFIAPIQYGARYKTLTLWNPTVAILWSWIFSPAIGSYIHMRNWVALDEPEEAAYARLWLYLSIGEQLAQLGGVYFAPRTTEVHFIFLALSFFIVWYFSFARRQRRYLDRNALNDYTKKSWTKILTIGVVAYILNVCCLAMIVARVSTDLKSGTERTQSDSDETRYGSFAQFVPKRSEAASVSTSQDASMDAKEATTVPTQLAPQTSLPSLDSRQEVELRDYANREFSFALRYPVSWIEVPTQTPNSLAHFISQVGMPVAECAVVVIRRPDIDNADQASINAIFRELPTVTEIQDSLAQRFEAPKVISVKVGALGPLPAHDARVTYSATSGTSTIFASGRMVTTASPGYIWTLSCGGNGSTPAAAEQAYVHWKNEIDQFITSFKYL